MVKRWQHEETGRFVRCDHNPGAGWFRIDEFLMVGDIVTRDGTDWQFVAEIDTDNFSGTFICVKASERGWCKLGDVEYNLARRYSKVGSIQPDIAE